MNTVRWVILAAAVEPAVTGLILIISPSLFAWLVLGGELSEPGQVLGRLAGIVLLSLALACWPAPPAASYPASSIRALFIYNLLATIYLTYVGVSHAATGILLWPAVALHVILTILVVRVWLAGDGK